MHTNLVLHSCRPCGTKLCVAEKTFYVINANINNNLRLIFDYIFLLQLVLANEESVML